MAKESLRTTVKPVFDLVFRNKKFNNTWGGAFNGQEIRRKIFNDIINLCEINEILETGSFRGNTTEYMHINSRLKVQSIEAQLEYYRYSKLRFLFNPNVKVYFGDSRKKLKELLAEATPNVKLFYLDAHWSEDLPLGEEVNIIFERIKDAVILIDDFKVEGDPGYYFDSYGETKTLDMAYLKKNVVSPFNLFFPVSSTHETGSKRGCAVITNSQALAKKLEQSQNLKSFGE